MIMVSDYAAKLMHEERAARWQAEASAFRRARSILRRKDRTVPAHTTPAPVPSARVPRQRRQKAPARENEPAGQRRSERNSSPGRRAA
jgi:hypothetical protein